MLPAARSQHRHRGTTTWGDTPEETLPHLTGKGFPKYQFNPRGTLIYSHLSFIMMKATAFLLLAAIAFAAQTEAVTPPPQEITVSQLVTKLCPNISSALFADFKILSGLVGTAGNAKISVPSGDIVLVAPTDAAFTTLLGELTANGVSMTALEGNTSLIMALIGEHIAVAPSATSQTATTLTGSTMSFAVSGAAASIDAVVAAASKNTATVSVSDGANPVTVATAVPCPAQGQYALGTSSVIVPKQFASLLGGAASSPSPTTTSPSATSPTTTSPSATSPTTISPSSTQTSPAPAPKSSASRWVVLGAGAVVSLLAIAAGV